MNPVQFVLPMKDLDRALLASVRVRAALRAFAKEVGFKRVADLWGCSEDLVGQKIDEKNRNAVKPHELMAAMACDLRGGIIAVLCDEMGYEMPGRKVEPTSEADRLIAAAGELFGPDVLELLRRKAGL